MSNQLTIQHVKFIAPAIIFGMLDKGELSITGEWPENVFDIGPRTCFRNPFHNKKSFQDAERTAWYHNKLRMEYRKRGEVFSRLHHMADMLIKHGIIVISCACAHGCEHGCHGGVVAMAIQKIVEKRAGVLVEVDDQTDNLRKLEDLNEAWGSCEDDSYYNVVRDYEREARQG